MAARTPAWKTAAWMAEQWMAAWTATLLMPARQTTAWMAAQQMATWTATRTAAWQMPAQLLARCGGTTDTSTNESSNEHATLAPAEYQPTNTMNILIYPSTKYTNERANTHTNANESNNECTTPATMNGPTNTLMPSTNITSASTDWILTDPTNRSSELNLHIPQPNPRWSVAPAPILSYLWFKLFLFT